jgi:hypothetical protein
MHLKWGSLGSSLHKHKDGTYFAYARWPSKIKRQVMLIFAGLKNSLPMSEFIDDPIVLDILDDYIQNLPNT